MSESCLTFSLLEGGMPKAFQAAGVTHCCCCSARDIPGTLLSLHPCCTSCRGVAYLVWWWMQMMFKMCPASRGFEEPDFLHLTAISSQSPIIKPRSKQGKCWALLSHHGKCHRVQVHLHPWQRGCCREFCVNRQLFVLRWQRCQAFQEHFSLSVKAEILLRDAQAEAVLGHTAPLFTLICFYMAKVPVVSMYQHGHDLLLWGYFALNFGCVCLFHSKYKDLFPLTPPHPHKIAVLLAFFTLTPSLLWKETHSPFNKITQNLIWNSVYCWMHSVMCRGRVKFATALQWPWLEWAKTKIRSKPASWEEKH